MPVGYLVESGVMKAVNSNPGVNADAESVAEFFSKVRKGLIRRLRLCSSIMYCIG